MNVKDWLRRVRRINEELVQLKIARQEAWEIATKATVDTTKERVKHSQSNSSENHNNMLLEYDLKISRQREKLLQYKIEILEAIATLEDAKYRTLLIAYYINCKSWEEVAQDLGYEVRWIYKLHGRALQDIEIHYKSMILYKL